jgi:hypothetical protein
MYNQDDCDSTLEGVLWLRSTAVAHASAIGSTMVNSKVEEALGEEEVSHEKEDNLAALLLECGDLDNKARSLMSAALHYEKRELKPMWWRRFDWLQASDLELEADPDAMSLTLVPQDSPHYMEP